MIKRVLRPLFVKRMSTYFEIESTDNGAFVMRALTPEARAWARKFVAEPLPNGDHLVSAIVLAIAADAVARGYLVRFVPPS